MKLELEKTKYPSKRAGYSAVAVMTLAQVFAFIDRQIPAMLVEPIKQDFNLNDSQIALLGELLSQYFMQSWHYRLGMQLIDTRE